MSIFYEQMGDELTPVQYAILSRLAGHPGIDQVSLAGLAAIDTSTGATVCARLEEKGLLERKVIPQNRRRRASVEALEPAAQRLRDRLRLWRCQSLPTTPENEGEDVSRTRLNGFASRRITALLPRRRR